MLLRLSGAILALLLSVASSFAQSYPNKSVRVVVGFAAGGPTDVIARIVAQKLSDALGHQFYVENIGGAGGNTASGQVARAPADGYTIMVVMPLQCGTQGDGLGHVFYEDTMWNGYDCRTVTSAGAQKCGIEKT